MDKNLAKKKKLTDPNEPKNTVMEESSKITDVKAAKEKLKHFIILNAWRHQKEKTKLLEIDVKTLTNQVESLHLQIYALKHLLDAEKLRVVHFNSDLRKILTSLEECKHEKHSLVKEKEQLEVRLCVMEEKLAGTEMENKNQKNELITARSEAHNWEKQLEKEREKLSKLKDERKFFIEEVRSKGNLLMWQIRSFEQFSRFFNILQSKPNNPALPWDESLGRIDPEPDSLSSTLMATHQQPTNLKKSRLDIQEAEEPKETTNSSNSRKTSREPRVKSTSYKGGKKSTGRGREDRGVGKVDFGKNVGCIKKLLKEGLSLLDEPD